MEASVSQSQAGMASQGEAEMHNILVSLAVTVLLLSPIGIVACLKRPSV